MTWVWREGTGKAGAWGGQLPQTASSKVSKQPTAPGVLSSGVAHYTLQVFGHLLQNWEWRQSEVTGSLRKGTTNGRLSAVSNGNTSRLTQWFSTRGSCVPHGCSTLSGDILVVTVGMGDTAGI